jgi:K+-transporting ATPase ATPase A chain
LGNVAVAPELAWNTAVSFVTNTNWQNYGGESTMSHLTQMAGLAVQNFASAAVGMAVAAAVIRGIVRRRTRTIGNFWVDLVRGTLRVLLPLAFVVALVLVSQGVVQSFTGTTAATTLEGAAQLIPGGPVASQVAIKHLGTNGGGFFNANSAHPFENPNGFTNLVVLWAQLVIPFAFAVTFGILVRDRRMGRVVAAVMIALIAGLGAVAVFSEVGGNPRLDLAGVDQAVSTSTPGGNLEGKEVRFGPVYAGTFAAATTGTSSGAVNSMHDSYTPLGGLAPMVLMMVGEVSPGGVGSGLVGILIFSLLAVFIAGLMVGRTPEFLGKKIQATEMKLVVIYILAMPIVLLGFAAASVVLPTSSATLQDPGPHGLSEVLYNFASTANNNGSAFAGMGTGTDWYTTTMGIAMLVGRFALIVPALAIAGSLAQKQRVPVTAGTFPTNTPLFAGLVLGVVVVVAGLTFFPALALGPIVEHLSL